jgi:glycolate oxidase
LTEVKHHVLYNELAAIAGSKYVSDDDFVLFAYSRDTGPYPGKIQGIVARPASTEEVVEIVKLANRTNTPVVPSGGRAGIYGVPPGSPGRGIVVDLTRLDKVLSIDEDNMCATAQAGIRLAEFDTKLGEKGWSIHTAVAPWYSDTVGGQLSALPGGGAGVETSAVGWNRHFVNGMKVVLPTGSVLQTGTGGNVGKNVIWAPEFGGPDFTPMFIGDAGAFGIKVEATYRMFRAHPIRKGGGATFKSFEDLYRCYRSLCLIEPAPYAILSAQSPFSMKLMGCPEEWTFMWVAAGYSEEEIALKSKWVKENIERAGGKEADDPGVMEFVKMQCVGKSIAEMGEWATPGRYALMEVVCPLGQLQECFTTMASLTTKRLEERDMIARRHESCVACGCNTTIFSQYIYWDDTDERYREGILEINKEFFDVAASHGWMPDTNQRNTCKTVAKYWTPAFHNYMATIKKALDPNNIMNPGMWGDLL